MTLDGLMFKGQPVKVRRPNDYNALLLPLELREKMEPLNPAGMQLSSAGSSGLGLAGFGGGGGGGGGPVSGAVEMRL